ncbi:MAG: cytochrome b/b6 domain-containing protein [Ardenticatenaceae bacterium]|nr:cytochrome b/b6 domain-containing protein [Ardenticatenaceae bacterium]
MKSSRKFQLPSARFWLIALLGLAALLLVAQQTLAQDDTPVDPTPTGPPLHPNFALLDAAGNNVLDSGEPISTMNTCGVCHDTAFIAEHSFHVDAGLSEMSAPGETGNGRSWDISTGTFGKWNPLVYHYLTPEGDDTVDLTTPGWLMLFSDRHVGGGPAITSRDGAPLLSLAPDTTNLDASIIDPATGELVGWDWQESGVAEMNCFLCHLPDADNVARIAAMAMGDFQWASTATLLGTDVVTITNGRYHYNIDAFDEDGLLLDGFVNVQDPTNANCGNCHGVVHTDMSTPLTLESLQTGDWSTLTTGQVMSPQRLLNSGLNLTDKETLSRSWDIHMERVVDCVDCHYALNNPVYFQETDEDQLDHLVFDPRRLDFGEYLYRPLHEFAKGSSTQGTLAPQYDNSLRRCDDCHSIEVTHNWLPYKERHMDAVSCESCHIGELYAPTLQSVDWTALQADGTPLSAYRGIEGEIGEPGSLITGYEPVLLPRENADGSTTLAPHNLISTWFWVYGEPERPVLEQDLQAAWFDGDEYANEIVDLFDADGNGRLSTTELVLDSDAKVALISKRLADQGLSNPRISGEIQPYSINHNVGGADWAIRDCATCHGEESRVSQPLVLANYLPGGIQPTFVNDGGSSFNGTLTVTDEGALEYALVTNEAGLYILGHDAVNVVDWIGIILFLGVFAGVIVHGGLRYAALRRQPPSHPQLRELYMYSVYERLWHWLQTVAILLLIVTGLIIHKPDKFGMFSFAYMVQIHNILAAILVINAFLSLFYHLVSGEIKQYLPRPRGFFDQAIEQSLYYLRGIFRNEPHPFEKVPERKLNPLQQVTYFGILNVLLPLQILTGILMWGAQRWPNIAAYLGGLPGLGPFHTLIAWLFATFIVMHVYLTTTGHTPLAGIKSMMLGWDEVEVHDPAAAHD